MPKTTSRDDGLPIYAIPRPAAVGSRLKSPRISQARGLSGHGIAEVDCGASTRAVGLQPMAVCGLLDDTYEETAGPCCLGFDENPSEHPRVVLDHIIAKDLPGVVVSCVLHLDHCGRSKRRRHGKRISSY
jgi:hypothetical protein